MCIKNEIAKINEKKYLYPPTWQQIEEYVNDLGVNYTHFERFFGIHFKCLTQIKRGVKRLPAHAWHFVFLKIKPTYGAGFVDDYNKELINKEKEKLKKFKPITHSTNNISTEQHDRISSLK